MDDFTIEIPFVILYRIPDSRNRDLLLPLDTHLLSTGRGLRDTSKDGKQKKTKSEREKEGEGVRFLSGKLVELPG